MKTKKQFVRYVIDNGSEESIDNISKKIRQLEGIIRIHKEMNFGVWLLYVDIFPEKETYVIKAINEITR